MMSPALPTGIVVFLFTDIQGSTQLWQKYPAEMPQALAQHHALLTSAIQAHGGYVFQIIGDAFCGAFHTAREALQAALEAQRLLLQATWGATGQIRVRMALHAGAAEVRPGETTSGEYVSGITLSRAARLLSAGHGGQVLLSLPAAELVRDHLPEGASLIDLGSHRLKDLVRPEQIYQAVAYGLPADFPPLKTLDSLPHNLPIQLTSFIGRASDLAHLSSYYSHGLRSTRLLTLVGPGGTGKTRLALQFAADHIENFPDGAWLVDLSALDDPSLVHQAIAATWELREQPGYPLLESLKDFLRHKHLLLLLDNCEHLLESCARLCRDLLLAAPELHLLVTSREPLGVPGEVLYRLAALPVPDLSHLPSLESLSTYDSVRLFIDRAQLTRPDFSLSNANAPAVAQICARLDGIPLAIELAAARVRVFTPEQINTRLEDRFRLLTGGSRTALPRQQTLQAAIDWSYDLLSEPEKTLFRRLSVFHGGWSFEKAEAICPGDGLDAYDLLDLLPRLVDRSLVVVDELPGGMRYRLLDTIRAYSRQRLLAAGEAGACQTRHLEEYLLWAEEMASLLGGPRQLEAVNSLEGEHDNLRAALEFAGSHDPEKGLRILAALWLFWYMHGHFVEGRRWTERLLQAAEGLPVPDGVRSHALVALGSFAYFQGDPEISLTISRQGLALARQAGDTRAELMHLHHLGISEGSLGNTRAAIETLEEGIRLGQALPESNVLGWLYSDLADLYRGQGDLDRAESLYQQDVELAHRLGEQWALAHHYANLADIAIQRGKFEQAEALLKESVPIFIRFGDQYGFAYCQLSLAKFAWLRGDLLETRALCTKILALQRHLGRLRYIPSMLEELADFMVIHGGANPAACLLGSTDSDRRREDYPPEPVEEQIRDHASSLALSSLGEAAFQSAYAEGAELSIEQAIERVFSSAL